MGSLLAVGLVFVSFFINKEGYPFETSTDDKCFFSSEITDVFVVRCFARSYKRRLASIMYQVFNNSLPDQLTSLLGTRYNDNNYKLRRSNDFSLIRYNSLLGRNSVRYRGPIIWNSIPRNIRNAASLQLFKATLKRASKSIDQIQFEKEACLLNSKDPDFVYF